MLKMLNIVRSNLVRSSEAHQNSRKRTELQDVELSAKRGAKIMEEERFDFENLKVYQRALEYVDFVYEITKNFPKTEDVFFNRPIQTCFNINLLKHRRRKWRN